MIVRILLFLLLVTPLALAAAWFADVPGAVRIDWLGYRIETSFFFLVAFVLTTVMVIAGLYLIMTGIARTPARIKRVMNDRHQEQGLHALTEALSALALSDYSTAQKMTRRADKLLGQPPVTMLLAAQLARLQDDEEETGRYLQKMLANPQTEFLAARGLTEQARRRRQTASALTYAERAAKLRPLDPWVINTLINLYCVHNRWEEALEIANRARRRRALGKEEFSRASAIIHFEQARQHAARGANGQAAQLLHKALGFWPGFTAAATLNTEVLTTLGKADAARKLLLKSWREQPHPELAEAYRKLIEKDPPKQQLDRVKKLAAIHPDHRESRLALAAAAIVAQDWTVARSQLELLLSRDETPRGCTLMADLEKAQNGDHAKSADWLRRAASALPDPKWSCGTCANETAHWQAHCHQCGSFATIEWKSRPLRFINLVESSMSAAEKAPPASV